MYKAPNREIRFLRCRTMVLYRRIHDLLQLWKNLVSLWWYALLYVRRVLSLHQQLLLFYDRPLPGCRLGTPRARGTSILESCQVHCVLHRVLLQFVPLIDLAPIQTDYATNAKPLLLHFQELADSHILDHRRTEL